MLVTINVNEIDLRSRKELFNLGVLGTMEGECQVPEEWAENLLRPLTPEDMQDILGWREQEEREALEMEPWEPDPEEERIAQLNQGVFAHKRRTYLMQNDRETIYQCWLGEGLDIHLAQVEEQAQKRLETLIPQMAKAAGATEELKARDMMAWVGLMNNCRARAEEIVLRELVYV